MNLVHSAGMGDKAMTAARVWQRFLFLLAVDAFGDKEAKAGKRVKNLLGAVEKHERLFKQAAREIAREDP